MSLRFEHFRINPTEQDFSKTYSTEIKLPDDSILKLNIRKYIPLSEKMEIISRYMERVINPQLSFWNPATKSMWYNITLIEAYVDNLSFDDYFEKYENGEKTEEAYSHLFDYLEANGIIDDIIDSLPTDKILLSSWMEAGVRNYYTHRESVLGILETISQDYSNLNLEATSIQEKLQNKEGIELLENVVKKLG